MIGRRATFRCSGARPLPPICGPTAPVAAVTVSWQGGGLLGVPLESPRRPTLSPGAGVGVMCARWTNAQPLELHGRRISNARTDLQRPYRSPTPVPSSHAWRTQLSPGAGVGVMYTRWTNAQPLEIHAPPISNARTDLQRTYPTLTAVGRRRANPHPRGPDNRSQSEPNTSRIRTWPPSHRGLLIPGLDSLPCATRHNQVDGGGGPHPRLPRLPTQRTLEVVTHERLHDL